MHSVMAVEKCNNDGQIMAQMFVIEQPKQTEALFTLEVFLLSRIYLLAKSLYLAKSM